MKAVFYKFRPILKETVWGGRRIAHMKRIADVSDPIGESWEISGLPDAETICANKGEEEGLTMHELIDRHGDELLGKGMTAIYGNTFPLLIKFIDAASDLSIQVHPDDATARRHGHDRGKTETWYVVKAEPGSKLLAGFRKDMTSESYNQSLANGTLHHDIVEYTATPGDCYDIPAGCIHAICSGTFIIEVQQTSNVTYRVFDYNRPDLYGQLRRLHTKEALECLDLREDQRRKVSGRKLDNGITELVKNHYFQTRLLTTSTRIDFAHPAASTFHILVCFEGEAEITSPMTDTPTLITEGESILIPAIITEYTITAKSGDTKLIEASLPV